MTTLQNLTDNETTLILAALESISPTGGGSDTYTLARKISALTGLSAPNELIGEMITTAHDEFRTAHDLD